MATTKIGSYEELREAVLETGGLCKTSMGVLRDIEDAGRLGRWVRDKIHSNLAAHNLGHLPVELPNDQLDVVRIYDMQAAVGKYIEAVLRPSDAGDKVLRTLASKDAEKKLTELRRLLDEAVEILES